MVNGDSEEIDLLELSKSQLKALLRKTEQQQGEASTEASRIREFIALAERRRRERLPQRRFGFPVQRVKEAQRGVLTRREEARQASLEGQKAVEEIEKGKKDLQEQQAVIADVLLARKVFESSDPRAIFALMDEQRAQKFFRAISARSKAKQQAAEIEFFTSRGFIEKTDGKFIFTEKGIEAVQSGDIDFSKFKFIQPPLIITTVTESPAQFSVKVTDVTPKPQKESFIVKGIRGFQKAQEKVANFTTRKIIPAGTAGFISKQIGRIPTTIIIPAATIGKPGQIIKIETGTSKFAGGVAAGIINEVREKPLELVAFFGAGKLVGVGLRTGGSAAVRAGTKIGGARGAKIARRITTFLGIGVAAGSAALVAGTVGKDIIQAPTATEKGEIVGKTITEFAAFGLGAKVGTRLGDIIIGRFRTRGLTEVPASKLTDPAVTAGRKTFPELEPKETPRQLRARFFEEKLPGEVAGRPRSFTATDIEAKEIINVATVGQPRGGTIKSEFPGQFGADVISPNFLRLGGSSSAVKTPKGFKNFLKSFDIAGSEPTAIRSELLDIKIPKTVGVRPGVTPKLQRELTELLGGVRGEKFEVIQKTPAKLRPGEAVIPFVKPERELIIVKGTQFDVKPKKFFVKISGQRIPIIQRTALPARGVPKSSVQGKLAELEIIVSESGPGVKSSVRAAASKPFSLQTSRASIPSSVTSSISSISKISSPKLSLPRSIPTTSISTGKSSRIRSPPISKLISSFELPKSSSIKIPVSPIKSSSIKFLPLRTPTVTEEKRRTPPLIRRGRGKRKKRDQELLFTDDLAIVPDISARAAGITVKIPKESLKGVAGKSLSGLGLRGIPIIK